MRFVGASDADMEKDSSAATWISLYDQRGSHGLGNRVELKNLNSFQQIGRYWCWGKAPKSKSMMKMALLIRKRAAGMMMQERVTRFVPRRDTMDYRYFPEPDLPPLFITQEYIDERKILQNFRSIVIRNI